MALVAALFGFGGIASVVSGIAKLSSSSSDHLFYPAGVGSDIQAKGLRHSFIPLSVECVVSMLAKAEDLRTETRSRRWEAGRLSLSLSGRLRKRQHTIDGDHVFLLKWRQGG
jgi:hypothetical protein